VNSSESSCCKHDLLKKLVDKFNRPRSTFEADNPRLSRTGLEEPVLDYFLA